MYQFRLWFPLLVHAHDSNCLSTHTSLTSASLFTWGKCVRLWVLNMIQLFWFWMEPDVYAKLEHIKGNASKQHRVMNNSVQRETSRRVYMKWFSKFQKSGDDELVFLLYKKVIFQDFSQAVWKTSCNGYHHLWRSTGESWLIRSSSSTYVEGKMIVFSWVFILRKIPQEGMYTVWAVCILIG